MSTGSQVEYTLNVLSTWSEGFALSFIFSDIARCGGLDADVLYCAQHTSSGLLVDDVLARVASATRPVVLNFYGCSMELLQDAVRRLNERRTKLEQMGPPLVLLCPSASRMRVQYGAPDLWHIRTMVPELSPEDNA